MAERGPRLSIRVRTTLGATVVVGVALVVAGVLVVLLLRRDLTASVDATAALRVEDVVTALEAGTDPRALVEGDDDEALVQIVDEGGRVVAASEDLAITVVMDGQPRSDDLGRQDSRVEVLYAPAPGRNAADRRIVELVRDAADPGRIVVVTSDRELARLVEGAGASVHGARWLLDQLDADA